MGDQRLVVAGEAEGPEGRQAVLLAAPPGLRDAPSGYPLVLAPLASLFHLSQHWAARRADPKGGLRWSLHQAGGQVP